jgi:hypothetical protein
MESKYLVLRAIATTLLLLAWSVLILGLLAALFLLIGSGAMGGTPGARAPLESYSQRLGLPAANGFVLAGVTALGAIGGFLLLCATGELIFLLLDIEHNTREIDRCLNPRL